MTKFGSLAAIGAVVLAATLATPALSNAQQPVPLVVDNNVIPSASVPLNEWVSNPCVTPTYYYPASSCCAPVYYSTPVYSYRVVHRTSRCCNPCSTTRYYYPTVIHTAPACGGWYYR